MDHFRPSFYSGETIAMLASLREYYYRQESRPVKIPYYPCNLTLLEEGLDVYWDGIEEQFKQELNNYFNERWNESECNYNLYFRSSALRGIEIEITSNASRGVIRIMLEMEMKLILVTDHYDSIIKVSELYDNIASLENVIIRYTKNPLLIEYARFIRIPFKITDDSIISYITESYHNLVMEFHNLNDQQKGELFKTCCGSTRLPHHIDYMLRQGFKPKMESLYEYKISDNILPIILNNLDESEETRYQLFKILSIKNGLRFGLLMHPSIDKYVDQLLDDPDEELNNNRGNIIRARAILLGQDIPHQRYNEQVRNMVTTLTSTRLVIELESWRDISESGKLYAILRLNHLLTEEQRLYYFKSLINNNIILVDPSFNNLWSRINTNNIEFNWFLYHQRIELPSSSHHHKMSVPQLLLLDPEESIKRIIKYNNSITLLQFLNITGFNIKPLAGLNNRLRILAERQPIMNMKSARSGL